MVIATEEHLESSALKPACLCSWLENPYGLVNLWEMYQILAHALFKLFDELRDFEIELERPLKSPPNIEEEKAVTERFLSHLAVMKAITERLELSSSHKQVKRIMDVVLGKKVSGAVISPLLKELRVRLREDMENHVYLCIPDRTAQRFWIKTENGYEVKVPAELMDSRIAERFPSASDDIDGALRCFVLDCFQASMFHLMRVVEIGVLNLAKIAGLKDPSPSWGAVLQYVEKIVLRTRYEDVPAAVQPYRKLLETVLPQMQAIQRAWRNKFTHVEDKIIPADGTITEQIASEILAAVEAFMRQLAIDLPPGA